MKSLRPTIMGTRHMIAATQYLAAEAGFKILEAGGNAIDAGVAAGISLGVVQPEFVNVAGVAPIIIYFAAENRLITIPGLGPWPKALDPNYFMKNHGVNVTKLTKAQIRDGKNGADLGHLTQAQREAVLKNTPLWFYVLREAELNGGKLKGVGARIVAETFHRAMEGSTHSIVRDTTFKPTLGPNNNTFRMVDLLLFAFEGKKSLLAPLG